MGARSIVIVMCMCSSILACRDQGVVQPPPSGPITTDQEFYTLLTQGDPFPSYTLFPGVDSVVSGTLNGSTAHRPMVRVTLNSKAQGALSSGRLPSGTAFPDGSIVLKEIRTNGQTTLLAVAYKDGNNPLSAAGWLWAEYNPDGSPFYSVQKRGAGCIGCHALGEGPGNDHIRTFERRTSP